jgi:hypothetical protein
MLIKKVYLINLKYNNALRKGFNAIILVNCYILPFSSNKRFFFLKRGLSFTIKNYLQAYKLLLLKNLLFTFSFTNYHLP